MRFSFEPSRRQVFVSYHHGHDRGYYESFSQHFADSYDVIEDNSVERTIDSDDPSYVLRRIREHHITGSSCTIVLCGSETPWRKYVDWEIEATLEAEHGLIGILLPTIQRTPTGAGIVPALLHDNVRSGYAIWFDWGALNNAEFLRQKIELANMSLPALIDNRRPSRERNG